MTINEIFETSHVTIMIMDLMAMDLEKALILAENKNGLTESQTKELFFQML